MFIIIVFITNKCLEVVLLERDCTMKSLVPLTYSSTEGFIFDGLIGSDRNGRCGNWLGKGFWGCDLRKIVSRSWPLPCILSCMLTWSLAARMWAAFLWCSITTMFLPSSHSITMLKSLKCEPNKSFLLHCFSGILSQ